MKEVHPVGGHLSQIRLLLINHGFVRLAPIRKHKAICGSDKCVQYSVVAINIPCFRLMSGATHVRSCTSAGVHDLMTPVGDNKRRCQIWHKEEEVPYLGVVCKMIFLNANCCWNNFQIHRVLPWSLDGDHDLCDDNEIQNDYETSVIVFVVIVVLLLLLLLLLL